MTKKDFKKEVPPTIIIPSERRTASDAITRSLKDANCAYTELSKMEDLGETPAPHDCTTKWLSEYIAAKEKAVNQAEFLTMNQKVDHLKHWQNIKSKALKYINVLQAFISGLPTDQYIFDAEKATIKIKDINSLLDTRCCREVPADAQKHWELINEVRKTIENLRNWEKEKDLKKYRLEELFSMTPEHFASLWATHEILINRAFDHLPYIVLRREATYNTYI